MLLKQLNAKGAFSFSSTNYDNEEFKINRKTSISFVMSINTSVL
jgi:hypothetical protein